MDPIPQNERSWLIPDMIRNNMSQLMSSFSKKYPEETIFFPNPSEQGTNAFCICSKPLTEGEESKYLLLTKYGIRVLVLNQNNDESQKVIEYLNNIFDTRENNNTQSYFKPIDDGLEVLHLDKDREITNIEEGSSYFRKLESREEFNNFLNTLNNTKEDI